MSYLVRFRKAEDITGDYVSLALPGDTTTAVLPHLFPLTAYEVNVFAQYEKGDSFPLTGEETTLEGKKERLKHSTLAIFFKTRTLRILNILSFYRTRGCSKSTSHRGDDQQL